MKLFVVCVIVVVAAVFATASAEADAGYFIPKAFYTLDAEGHKTQPHPVSPHTAKYLHRLRRQAFSSSSSSSSSSASSSSNGGPVYFSTHNTVSHTPAGTTSFSQRFGDDGSVSSSSHSSSGLGVGLSAGTGAGYDNSYGSNYAGVHFPTGSTNYGSNSNGANKAGFASTLSGGNYNTGYNTGYNSVPLASRFGSSASSSSSVSSNGGPVYFKTEQSVSHTPADNVNFSSRFGDEDTPVTVSKTVSTSGYIDEKGVHAKTTTTKN